MVLRPARWTWQRYAVTLAVTGAAGVVDWVLLQFLGEPPYLLLYPAVLIAAMVGGLRPGLLATLAGWLCTVLLLHITPGQINPRGPGVLVEFVLFAAGGVGISMLAAGWRASQLRERQQSKRLEQSERRFRSLTERIPHTVWETDPTGMNRYQSPAWYAYIGREEGSSYGEDWLQFYHPDDRAHLMTEWKRSLAAEGGYTYDIEARIRRYDGVYRWFRVQGAAVRDASGRVTGWAGTCTDIDEQKKASEALQRERQFLRRVIDTVPGLVFVKDFDGHFVLGNRALADAYGTTTYAVEGKTDADFNADKGQLQHFRKDDQEVILSGRSKLIPEEQVTYADGQIHWLSTVKTPLKGEEGDRTLVLGVSTDITDLKYIQTQLTAAKESAESANRAKDQFLAVLSHELRNPLTPVLATVGMLEGDARLDADTREAIEIIQRNTELEARLIDDLLDVTRIARGKVELDRRPVDLQQIIRRAIEVCRPDLEARQLELRVELEQAGKCTIDADATRLQQVFWNLLRNAAKFTPHGGRVEVRLRREQPAREGEGRSQAFAVVRVSDTGQGIEADALERIFNAFEQVERSITRQFGGLGLGLTISRALVELHGGTISAHSDGRGKGATFRVRLPLVSSEPKGPAQPGPAPGSVRPLHILLVEDHGDTAKIMQRLLRQQGHEVAVAGDTTSAIKLAEEMTAELDLLLSDLGLPDGTGLDLMRNLRQRGMRVPGIALSGYGQEQDIQQSREAGFAMHLIKPVNPRQLFEAIATVTRER